MSKLLTEHLELVSTSKDGITKLKRLFYDLAISGKLGTNSGEDKPAQETIEELRRDNNLNTNKPKKPVSQSSKKGIVLPENWVWTCCEEIAEINPKNSADDELLTSFVPMALINTTYSGVHDQEIRLWGEIKKGFTHFAENDVGIAKITPCFENSKACIFRDLVNGIGAGTTELYIVRPKSNQIAPKYLFTFFKSSIFMSEGEKSMTGTAGQKRLSKDFLRFFPFPLPPLAEQKRIVAKVDKLMDLCDRLEEQQTDAEEAHKQLVDVLLDALVQSKGQSEFLDSWHRIKDNFDVLFTTEYSVDALKQAILQLAVMGKLVPQDPNDEPASSLLSRIRILKSELCSVGELKKDKPLSALRVDQTPFPIPVGWQWSKIGDFSLLTEYGISEKTFDLDDGTPVLKMGDIQGGRVVLGGQKKVPRSTEVLFLEDQDLLYNRTNSAELVGKTGIFKGPNKTYTFASYLIRIKCSLELSEPAFLNLAMNSPYFRATQINPHLKQQCGQANVNGTILKNMVVPVPPLAEQKRIVAKVDELMALCDELKNQIKQGFELQNLTASTLTDSALNSEVIIDQIEQLALASK